ncbi:RNA polymerase sigma factor [Pontimicrobium sp. SW4]|uniref:RNA polymerase sigma factor n=1 Tax=Pontimicrobium sp. SW4 TaxID=3153519 RepID=A0AAU7BRG0_9FLAO
MLKVKDGNIETLGLLYERYKKRLFGYFYKLNNDAQLSEDLVQNVFVRILKYRKKFIDKGTFTSWIFRIARNVYYDHYKKNKTTSLEYDSFKDLVSYELDTTQNLNEEKELLQHAFKQLSINQMEILILSKYHEMPYKEIAIILDCNEGAVKTKVFRALKELRIIFFRLHNRTR